MAKTISIRSNRPQQDPTQLGRTFKASLKSGKVLLGGIAVEYLRHSLVKLYKHAGFDFIYLENEHTMFQGPELTDFVLAARDNGLPMIAKVGDLGRAEVARLLEAGVCGIQLPRTESRADLLQLIDYMKFPPVGTRAGAPCFGNVDYIWPADSRKWLKQADESTLIVAHIETQRGFENIEEIVTTPHLDMLYVGPYDFSISLGEPGNYDHPTVRTAMRKILQLCIKNGVAFGTTASNPKAAEWWVKNGCTFFEVVDEISLISAGAIATVDTYRKMRR